MTDFSYPIESCSESKPIPPQAKKVFEGLFFSVWQWDQVCYDGSTAVYERIKRRDYAYVIGVLPDERIMLIHDEQPDRGVVLTPAGGGVEEGEDPANAAARELLEETGYAAKEIVHWHSYRPNNRIEMNVHAFIGRQAYPQQEAKPESGERIAPTFFTFDEFIALGQNPKLRDWLLRIKLLEAQIDPAKKEEIRSLLFG